MTFLDSLVNSGFIKRLGSTAVSAVENIAQKVSGPSGENVKDFLVKEGAGIGRVVLQKKMSSAPIGAAVENTLLNSVAGKVTNLGKKVYRATPLPGYAQQANAGIRDVAFELKKMVVLQRGTEVLTDEAGNLLLDASGRPLTVPPSTIAQVTDRVRNAYFSSYGPSRFARTTANRFALDYASTQLINLAQQGLEELIPQLGPTDQNDPFTLQPYDTSGNASLDPKGQSDDEKKKQARRDKLKQLANIIVYQVLSSGINTQINKFRSNQVSLSRVTKSSSTQYGQRLAQNTEMALAYYGNRKPEVLGNITGNALASWALGASPSQVLSSLGARGIINASVGFYNVSKPTQQRLPTMGPGYRDRLRTMDPTKAAKRVEGTIKKVTQVHRVSQTRRAQGKLF